MKVWQGVQGDYSVYIVFSSTLKGPEYGDYSRTIENSCFARAATYLDCFKADRLSGRYSYDEKQGRGVL